MNYTNIAGTGLKVSKLCLGTMMFGSQADKESSIEMMNYAMDNGVNFFDTANIYTHGRSETIIGEALKGRRDEAVIATKVGGGGTSAPNGRGLGRKHILKSVDESLERLQTDYIDLFYMHVPDTTVPVEETIETMNYLIQKGKILYYGVSNFSAWQICGMVEKARAMDLQAPVITETVYNALTRGADEEILPFAREYNIGIAPYNPLAAGLLTGKHKREQPSENSRFSRDEGYKNRYWKEVNFDAIDILEKVAEKYEMSLIELAIRWIITDPVITSPIIGVSKLSQLQQNIEIINKGPLHPDAFAECDSAWALIKGDYFNYHR